WPNSKPTRIVHLLDLFKALSKCGEGVVTRIVLFTQEEQYTELLEPIPEPHQEQQNDSNVISDFLSVEQEGGTVDQH
ncbi:hypothetical protein Tco_0552414, partial [Tanacetum coccineum]